MRNDDFALFAFRQYLTIITYNFNNDVLRCNMHCTMRTLVRDKARIPAAITVRHRSTKC